MQAVILAGGISSRLIPFKNKSTIKIMGRTLIEHTLLSLETSGINDVIMVDNKNNELKKILKDFNIGINITYVQQPEPLGMGDALLRTEKYLENDFFVLSPYHFDFPEFSKLMEEKKQGEKEIVLLVKKDNILDRYGTIKTDGDKITDIMEKPKKGEELSDLRTVAIYLLTKSFIDILKSIPLEHYNFEKAISMFAKKETVRFVLTDKETLSLKYSWDILNLKDYIFKKMKKYISTKAKVANDAQIIGDVYIDDGAKIMEKACIKGPCYIGKNAYIGNNAILRQGVSVEEDSVVGAFSEIKNTVVMSGTKIHSGFIGDSVIGENSRIGAQFCTANKRLNRDTVKVEIKDEKIDTGLKFLGVLTGNNVHIGIKSSVMPGIIIGESAIVGPSTTVLSNVPSNAKYFTKFQEIVVKK